MKASISFASLLAAQALASRDIGPWKYSTGDLEVTIFDKGGMSWKIKPTSAYDLDAGVEYFRLEHRLVAPIAATDKVSFELAYTIESDPWTNKEVIAEDAVVCTLVQSTQDTRFWTQSNEDKSYSCTSAAESCVPKAVTNADIIAAADSGTGADWTNPLADDDEANPYCTPGTGAYACSAIKCIVQRPMKTTDTYDFQFRKDMTDNTLEDKMIIKPGRALLGINQSDCSTYCAYMEANLFTPDDGNGAGNDATGNTITIPIKGGASQLVSAASALAALLLAFNL